MADGTLFVMRVAGTAGARVAVQREEPDGDAKVEEEDEDNADDDEDDVEQW